MKLIFSFALVALLSSCAVLHPNTTSSGRTVSGGDSFAPYGGQDDDSGRGIFSPGDSEDPEAIFRRKTRNRYPALFMAETKPWMVGSVQEQWPSKHALPGSGWKGPVPQTPVMDTYAPPYSGSGK